MLSETFDQSTVISVLTHLLDVSNTFNVQVILFFMYTILFYYPVNILISYRISLHLLFYLFNFNPQDNKIHYLHMNTKTVYNFFF